MKNRIYGLLLFVTLLTTAGNIYSQGGKLFTLKECVETAIQNNLDVYRAGLQMQADETNWKQAKLNMLPDLNGFVNHGTNQGRSIDPFTNSYINQQVNYASYGISSGVVLFNGFSLQNNTKQSGYSYQASKMDWQQTKDNITINVILLYLQALNGQDQLVQAQNQAALSAQQVNRLEILNRDGAIKPSDLTDLKGQYANDQLAVINVRNNLEASRISLCGLMNIPYDAGMTLEPMSPDAILNAYAGDPETIYGTALQQLALIRAAEFRKESAAYAVKMQKGRLFPTLSLVGSANTNYSSAATQDIFLNTTETTTNDYVLVNGSPSYVVRQQNNFQTQKINYGKQINNNLFTTVGLNLSIPLFNSLQARNRVKLAKLDLQNATASEKMIRTQTQQNIEQAWSNMTAAYDRYHTLVEQVDAYTQSFRAAEVRFNEGVGTPIDYLTAKNNLDRANSNLIIARYDFVLRTKVLDYYQGKQLW